MIIEGIKNLLGEDLTKQVETALKGKGKTERMSILLSETTEVSFRPKSTTAPTAARPARKTH